VRGAGGLCDNQPVALTLARRRVRARPAEDTPMNPLRRRFGPSREDVWRQLSQAIGARYVDGGFWKGDRIEATHGDWTITIDTYTVHANNAHIPYTRLRAPYVNPGGFRFTVYGRGVFSDVAKWFGMQDIEIGDAGFDRDFIVKATSAAQVRELLSNRELRDAIARQPHIRLDVKDDEGWFGPTFPDGVDALSITVRGHLKDVERLKQLYELLATLLDELCRIGSAYDTAPDLRL
jgi:hypothetical protein